jgi:hypothetical protein
VTLRSSERLVVVAGSALCHEMIEGTLTGSDRGITLESLGPVSVR